MSIPVTFDLTTEHPDDQTETETIPALPMSAIPRVGEHLIYQGNSFDVVSVDWQLSKVTGGVRVVVLGFREDDTGAGE